MTQNNEIIDMDLRENDPNVSSSVDTELILDFYSNVWALIILIIAGVMLLAFVYTELRFRYRQYFYNKCLNEVIDAPAELNQNYNGKLVFLVGKLTQNSPVYFYDPVFPYFEITGVGLVKRQVEMYQFRRDSSKNYEKTWNSSPIKNSQEAFKNPSWRFKSETLTEEIDLSVSHIKLSKECFGILQEKGCLKPMYPHEICETVGSFHIHSDDVYYYLTQEKNELQVGDYRFRYFYLELGNYVTILGEYFNGNVRKFKGSLIFAENGVVSVESIFERMKERNRFSQNVVRVLTVVALLVSFLAATFVV
jgi:hypothetical protein